MSTEAELEPRAGERAAVSYVAQYLPAAVHHAVWDAHAVRRIDAVPWAPSKHGSTLVYNRAQVLELLRETAASRG